MNLFVLDTDPYEAARFHCDKHVVKMTLEAAQLLSTAHRLNGNAYPQVYKSTHIHHPCTKWVCKSSANYQWGYEYFRCLAAEYTYRYDKIHKSWHKLGILLSNTPNLIPIDDLTPFALAMPDKYKQADPVKSYRAYYIGDKSRMFKFTHRRIPHWIQE